MRRVTPGITKPTQSVPYGERVCAVNTCCGLVLKADTSIRIGDPIIGPDNKVHWVERILDRRAETDAVLALDIGLW